MTNDVKLIGFKASVDFHEKLKAYAEAKGITISDFLRDAVKQCLTSVKQVDSKDFTAIKEQLDKKDEQLDRKDEQIEHLHKLLAMEKQNMASITQQLEKKELMLEDLRKRSVWERLKGAFSFASS